MYSVDLFFKLSERGTSTKTEVIAGFSTFMTMAYVLVVQPSAICGFGADLYITDTNGVLISKQAILVMCALISGLITLLMGFFANLPFALSTGMGTNFLLGALVQSKELSFGSVMSIVLISGVIFLILTIFGLRELIVRIIPKNIKVSISAAIGFFIAYLGFKNTGIGSFTDGISMGDFTSAAVLLALTGLVLISVLTAYHVKGAILIGILVTTLIGIPLGITKLPEALFVVPSFSDIGNVCFYFDWKTIFTVDVLVWIFITFFDDFFSTVGTVLGVAGKAKMLDEKGDLPGIQKPFLVDAIGTCVGSATGCTTITTFVESSSGVEAGGRTGLTSVTCGLLFLFTIFSSPLFLMIPDAATGPALIFVGFLMIRGFADIDFSKFDDAFGSFIMIVFSTYTANIAVGIACGILAHVAIKILTGKYKEIHPGLYILCIPLILYFVFH